MKMKRFERKHNLQTKGSMRESQAFVLVAVLIVTMLASMVAVSVLFHMRVEKTAAAAGIGLEFAYSAAMSGVNRASEIAQMSEPGSLSWRNDSSLFYQQLAYDDGVEQWYYTVYSAGGGDDTTLRYGLTDEASKLALSKVNEENLALVSDLNESQIHSMLDYIDADLETREEGAEQDYYNQLVNAYAIRNGPLSTLDELFLVRGFDASVIYGEDVNFNLQLDPNEDDGETLPPADDSDGVLNIGLRQYLTVMTYELNLNNAGEARININEADADLSALDLPVQLMDYLEAARANKQQFSHVAELYQAQSVFKDDRGQEQTFESGVDESLLPLVLDNLTTGSEVRLEGLININTASRKVLSTIPGIDDIKADSIVTARDSVSIEERQTTSWLVQENLMTKEEFLNAAPHITARSYQFHFYVVGYGIPSGRFRVLEVLVDTAVTPPQITYLRDLTRLGTPFKFQATAENELGV
jgi:hypothetical protein